MDWRYSNSTAGCKARKKTDVMRWTILKLLQLDLWGSFELHRIAFQFSTMLIWAMQIDSTTRIPISRFFSPCRFFWEKLMLRYQLSTSINLPTYRCLLLNLIIIKRPLKLGSLKVACDFTPFLQHLGKPKRKTIALNAQMDILHAPLSETKKRYKRKL